MARQDRWPSASRMQRVPEGLSAALRELGWQCGITMASWSRSPSEGVSSQDFGPLHRGRPFFVRSAVGAEGLRPAPRGEWGRASAATMPTRPRTTGPFVGAGALL